MRKLYDALAISRKVSQLGEEISRSYMGKELLVVGILKGGFMFMSDLVRAVSLPTRIDFARLSSYGKSDSPEGDVKIVDDVHEDIQGVHVLVVDDIMDTGHSLLAFKRHLERMGPASVKICTMIDKTARREAPISPDFFGFRIEEGFVVGYGLDYAESYRTLPELYVLDASDIRGAMP
ncbi:MAG TPA: hypoxanthine phosphoribosyltransferase [Deltaproteobacteria bacterium]|nr:hypoxanthine phosphoribosyltransferase [Deltaproteobacteria bacterium]HPP79370.1 hypoxanthine phosphoribosyltransferase [Deltaproteobacteria bacterium]